MNIKKFSALSGLVVMLAAACGASDPATDAESGPDADGWIELFSGENLDGWRSYGAESAQAPWKVQDGAIVLDVDDDEEEMTGGDLITDRQFENFELELEWKISPGGNSGIFFGVREIDGLDVAYLTGVEMQVLDDARHPDGAVPETSAGSCYALYARSEDVTRPVGEYNEARIVVRDGVVEHWLNGVKIVDYDMNSEDWARRVAASKFADWEHFARYRRGHIGLQDHTDRVWYRNIRIREL
jgi:hypothetical protein